MTAEATAADLRILVRNEVDRLPAKYREPVRLCYFEGRTHDGAAAELGWPVGTVRGRLSRARALLRTRLGRRGIGITPASLVAALAGGGDARAEIPRLLRETTLAAATRDASVAAAVTALAMGVVRGLVAVAVVKAVAVALLVVSLVAAGAGIAVFAGREEPRQGKPDPNGDQAEARAPAVDRYGDPLPKGAIARLGTVRFRQSLLDGSNYLSRVLFSPDGRSLVTVGRQGRVSIWESGSGRLVRSIKATEAAIAPDGKSLATARTGLVQLWDFADGREAATGRAPTRRSNTISSRSRPTGRSWSPSASSATSPRGKPRRSRWSPGTPPGSPSGSAARETSATPGPWPSPPTARPWPSPHRTGNGRPWT